MPRPDRSQALDHIVVCCSRTVPWTTCSGISMAPRTARSFEGVIGKNMSNPIPPWVEHGAERKVVPYMVATDMESPHPDSGGRR